MKRTEANFRNQSGPGRGLDSAPSDSTLLRAAPAARVSLGEVVAERLRQAILDDEVHPGQHLREDEISEMLEVSRGPVRVALLILQREGLVDLAPHRGATVARLSIEDVGEIYSLRSALEALAIRLAIRRGEPADLDALEESLAELRVGMRRKPTDAVGGRLDLGFHDNVFKAAHHERLYESWCSIRTQVYWCMLSRKPAPQTGARLSSKSTGSCWRRFARVASRSPPLRWQSMSAPPITAFARDCSNRNPRRLPHAVRARWPRRSCSPEPGPDPGPGASSARSVRYRARCPTGDCQQAVIGK